MKLVYLFLALSLIAPCAGAQQVSPELARQASLKSVQMKAFIARGVSSQAEGCLFENAKTKKKDGEKCAKFLASLKEESNRRSGWDNSVRLAEENGFHREIQASVAEEKLSRDQIDQIASEIFPKMKIK